MLHSFIQVVLPEIISVIEIVGVIIIVVGAIRATYYYFKSVFEHRNFHVKILLGDALSTGLEFKMGAEILKTVLIEDYHELYLLAAIIVIRIALTLVIHWEVMTERKECSNEELHDLDTYGQIMERKKARQERRKQIIEDRKNTRKTKKEDKEKA